MWKEGKVAWYPLFAHVRPIPEIFYERVGLCTSYTWLLLWRNNQTRYTTCSVFTQWWLPLSETQGVTRQGLRYKQRRFHCHCACGWKQMAESRGRWTSQISWVATGIRLYHRGYNWLHPPALLSTWNLPFEYSKEWTWGRFIKVLAFTCHVCVINSRRMCFGAIQ